MEPCTEIWQSTLLISCFTSSRLITLRHFRISKNDLVNTTIHCLVYLKSLLQLGSETCKQSSTSQGTGRLTCAKCNKTSQKLQKDIVTQCLRAWERPCVAFLRTTQWVVHNGILVHIPCWDAWIFFMSYCSVIIFRGASIKFNNNIPWSF